MKWKYAFFILLLLLIIANCNRTAQREMTVENLREMNTAAISSFHPEITISLGWVPYEEKEMVPTGKNQWLVLNAHGPENTGMIPLLVVSFPGTRDSILLDMDMSNELLGKLIKHSAITQVPIQRPFSRFFAEARCGKCHPPHIKLNESYP